MRSATATGAALLKVVAGVLALALVRPSESRLGRRLLLSANALVSAVLVLWGGTNVAVGALGSPMRSPLRRV